MNISIKGILLSSLVAGLLALVLILPVALLSDSPTPPPLFMAYGYIVGAVVSLFQGFLLMKITGQEKFPASAVCCAALSGFYTARAQGVFAGVVMFAATVALLFVGKLFAGKRAY